MNEWMNAFELINHRVVNEYIISRCCSVSMNTTTSGLIGQYL